jgi:hypothetical protein
MDDTLDDVGDTACRTGDREERRVNESRIAIRLDM